MKKLKEEEQAMTDTKFENINKLSKLKKVVSLVRIGGYYKWDLKFPFRHFVKEELIVTTENGIFKAKI